MWDLRRSGAVARPVRTRSTPGTRAGQTVVDLDGDADLVGVAVGDVAALAGVGDGAGVGVGVSASAGVGVRGGVGEAGDIPITRTGEG
jgi:hypothetical protein